ncbi:hypothetical protein B0I35DRAFT_361508 [Stachybotrys elegans]|uniref:Uncharacterized protein n=1 Tax=Stachybotrys elegans TaxID=80388 RepID=A0A8K0SJP7_9HYPO|nr:hypothetical protein B0I35DRAFT_361508 [Stachybotrys elegans]
MFQHFTLRHIPALLSGTTMAFGGLWPLWDARGAMLEFGMPANVADAPSSAPVMAVGTARTSILGFIMLLFYYRQQFEIVDSILAVTGFWAGAVDCYIVWKLGNRRQAIFRLVSSWLLALTGYLGWTANY